MVLIPEVVDAVAPMPVLGAGGIGRGRQMAAAMALGAQGVWCGSVWLTTEEAETHPVVKEKFLAATSADTVRSRSLHRQARPQLRSAWTDEWDDAPTRPIRSGCRCSRSSSPRRSGGSPAAAYDEGLRRREARQLLRRSDRRHDEPAQEAPRRWCIEMVEEFIESVESLAKQLEY